MPPKLKATIWILKSLQPLVGAKVPKHSSRATVCAVSNAGLTLTLPNSCSSCCLTLELITSPTPHRLILVLNKTEIVEWRMAITPDLIEWLLADQKVTLLNFLYFCDCDWIGPKKSLKVWLLEAFLIWGWTVFSCILLLKKAVAY